VETWVDLVGHSHLRDGRRRVAAADHGARAAAGGLGESFGDCRVPAANSDTSKAHRPVPEDRLRPQDALPDCSRAFGPMSRPSIPSGIWATTWVGTPAFGSFATTWSAAAAPRRATAPPCPGCGGRRRSCPSRPAKPPRHSARGEERVRHRPADEQRVHLAQELLDHLDLVAHLGPARMARYGLGAL